MKGGGGARQANEESVEEGIKTQQQEEMPEDVVLSHHVHQLFYPFLGYPQPPCSIPTPPPTAMEDAPAQESRGKGLRSRSPTTDQQDEYMCDLGKGSLQLITRSLQVWSACVSDYATQYEAVRSFRYSITSAKKL